MSFNEELVKNYKARQKSLKEIKKGFKDVLGVPFELSKDLITGAYTSGKLHCDVVMSDEQKKVARDLDENFWDFKNETLRELLEEKNIAVIVDWFNIRCYSENDLGYIRLAFSEDSKKEQDKKLKEN
nr:MAG TPA: hypothetical protein [Ackermannviridae sp.]